MATIDDLLSRASIGELTEPAPSGAELEQILEAGLRAPDHGKLRPWRFVLIRGEARAPFAAKVIAALSARDPANADAIANKVRRRMLNAPLIIALGAKLQHGHKIPEIEQMLSVGAAAMNLLNAIHALGYAGVWLTGAQSYEPAVLEALGMAPTDKLAGFLFVGTAAAPPLGARRPALEGHVTEWHG